MEQYIPKSALVTEIKRRNKKLIHTMNKLYYASNYNEWKAVAREYRSLISFINTFEVKEMDLTWKDVDLLLNITDEIANDDSMEEKLIIMSQEEYCREVLKRFKAQKGE